MGPERTGDSTWLPPPPTTPAPAGGWRGIGFVVAGLAVLGVVAAALAGGAVFLRMLRATSDSMAPTFRSGDHVLVTRYVGTISRGDVLAFRHPTMPRRSHLFRVVVLPGERFQIVGGVVHVNGKALDEPYVAPENRDGQNYGPYQIPSGQYFLMGDNRRNAMDSRFLGAIERELIWGKWVQ